MGLLGDLFSEIDRKKRQLRGLLSDPVETLYQGVRNFGAEQQGLLDTQARAYPWTGMTPDAKPDARARKELADAGAAQGMAAATVWHGSPNKFDKFDSSKIGTGEGAQAYGHGLYLADSPEVAKGYKTKLEAGRGIEDDDTIARLLNALGGDTSKAAAEFERRATTANIPGGKERMLALAERVRSGADPRGSLYKVDLPDEHIAKMLDWDKPLSQQAPEVQAAAQKLGYPIDRTGGDFQRWASSPSGGLSMNLRGPKDQSGLEKQAADVLRQAGIPGIRYLDGGSRQSGQGTSNYVVFPGNEDILKILERNGQGLLGP